MNYPRTAAQKKQKAEYNATHAIAFLPKDAGMPRWSWWAAPWPPDVFYALAALEAKRMQFSQLGRWLEPPVVQ